MIRPPPRSTLLSLHDALPILEEVKELSSARPELAIKTGETLGDGLAVNMVAAMTGGAQTRTWIGGKVVDMHTDRKSTRLNSSHLGISYAVFCLKNKI